MTDEELEREARANFRAHMLASMPAGYKPSEAEEDRIAYYFDHSLTGDRFKLDAAQRQFTRAVVVHFQDRVMVPLGRWLRKVIR